MNEQEIEIDETDGAIPFTDKRRFNTDGERIANDETLQVPVKSATEIALEAALKIET